MLDSGQVQTVTPHEELLALPVAEKLDLIELLWDSLTADRKNSLPEVIPRRHGDASTDARAATGVDTCRRSAGSSAS
jgi:hypothetical protein